MIAQVALLAVLLAPVPGSRLPAAYRPRIEVWTDRGDDPYTSGQAARVYFRTELDAYVTIFRVDTDGRVRVLFPREPWEDNFARGDREYEVRGGDDRDAFSVDDYPGVGYLFAVASADPFVYDPIESEDHWDYRVIADGRIRGDPYVALTDLAQRILPPDDGDWDYDIAPYYVQRHYDYPRFLCYDCHAYVSYPYWSPYDYTCVRFRIVVFDDPYYYPYRYYGGTRVVFTRPFRPQPRFIFKDRRGSEAFITRVRARPVNDDRRRTAGVRGRDLGGIGIIPPPRERPQRPDRPDRPERPDRPDNPQHPDRPERREQPQRPERPERRVPSERPPVFVQPPVQRRAEPQAPPPRRAAPATPRVERRTEPRSEPRVEPKREAPKERPKQAEPELKRRKP